ncbi:MAG: Tfp pilus assembly protein FimT/FimU, partial [Alphaproteobacteria bacterium]
KGKKMLRNKIKAQSKQQEYKNAGGRTMMEMLGTLAIIGVLSIGGIAGYNYAMDKYRANVTINDINLRAVDLITQAGRGIDLSLAEWGQTSTMGYTFSDPEWADDGSIALKISGLPERVCEMVVDTLGNRFDIEVGATRYTGDNSICGENNAVTVFFEGGTGDTGDTSCTDVVCGECEVCVSGQCVSSPDNISCLGGYCANGLCIAEDNPTLTGSCSSVSECGDSECMACDGACYAINSGNSCTDDDTGVAGICYNGSCQIGECNTNSDCDAGYFCGDQNLRSTSETKPGKCQKLDFLSRSITVNNSTETWYMSRYAMSWWDAQSACERLGKTMVTVNDLVSGWSSPSHGTFTRTERAQKLYDAIGNAPLVLTSDIYSDSCCAFTVDLSDGFVYHIGRADYISTLALCH